MNRINVIICSLTLSFLSSHHWLCISSACFFLCSFSTSFLTCSSLSRLSATFCDVKISLNSSTGFYGFRIIDILMCISMWLNISWHQSYDKDMIVKILNNKVITCCWIFSLSACNFLINQSSHTHRSGCSSRVSFGILINSRVVSAK